MQEEWTVCPRIRSSGPMEDIYNALSLDMQQAA